MRPASRRRTGTAVANPPTVLPRAAVKRLIAAMASLMAASTQRPSRPQASARGNRAA